MRIVAGVTAAWRETCSWRVLTAAHRSAWPSVFLKEFRRTTAVERTRWSCISAHLGAGMRLRAATRRLRLTAPPSKPCWIRVDGSSTHERAPPALPRAHCREAVRRIEKARTTEGRRDPMRQWTAGGPGRRTLVSGRSLRPDGERFVVAVQNDPAHPDPRGLTMSEREVAEFVGLGRSTKEIGYILGVSSPPSPT